MNLAMLLDLAAGAAPGRVALGPAGSGMTFAGLRERSRRLAGGLRETGAERVAFLDVAGPAFVETLFAAARAGLPFAPLNYRLRAAELAGLLRGLGPALLVHGPGLAARAAEAARLAGAPTRPLPAGTEGAPVDVSPAGPESIAVLLHTSGTTAAPRAAVLRHRQLFAYVVGAVELASAGEEECALMAAPTYHVAGVAGALTTAYACRRGVHLPDFDAREWLRLAAVERVTHAFVVPTMLARIVAVLESEPGLAPACLRVLAYGGAPCPPGLVERALAAFPSETGFVNAFGLTETSSTVSVLGPEDHRRAFASRDPAVRSRLRSAGRALPGVELRISAEGEVLVRGEQVSGEYLGRPGRVDAEGWFHTGDLGRLDRQGYLFVEGRADDVIIRGGENISPLEIEEVLLAHPAVREAAVVGLPDAEWGQRVAAAAVLGGGEEVTEEELRGWLRARLSSYKVPDRVRLLAELPYTPTGKLRRREVAAMLDSAGTGPL